MRSHCSGAGTLHACQVHSNGGHGLDLSYEASLLIHGSQIFDNAGGCGVLFTHSANGVSFFCSVPFSLKYLTQCFVHVC